MRVLLMELLLLELLLLMLRGRCVLLLGQLLL
jgi:hypothetical protein